MVTAFSPAAMALQEKAGYDRFDNLIYDSYRNDLMKPVVFTCFLTGAAIVVAPLRGDDQKREIDRLQGSWRGMIGFKKDIPFDLKIQGTAATATITAPNGEQRTIKGKIRLDEKAKPKTFDWVDFVTSDGQRLPDKPAIYELDGDELKICFGATNGPRPTEFKAGPPGRPPELMLFKRQKDETQDKRSR